MYMFIPTYSFFYNSIITLLLYTDSCSFLYTVLPLCADGVEDRRAPREREQKIYIVQ